MLNMPMFGCSSKSGMTNGSVIPKRKKGLVIAKLNINSLIKHFNEIRLFLKQNAIGINESKVDNFISDTEMHIACYNIN